MCKLRIKNISIIKNKSIINLKAGIITNNIEKFRSQVKEKYQADKVLFCLEEIDELPKTKNMDISDPKNAYELFLEKENKQLKNELEEIYRKYNQMSATFSEINQHSKKALSIPDCLLNKEPHEHI